MFIIREFCLVLFTAAIVKCVSLQEQIDHITRRKQESYVGLDAIPQRRKQESYVGLDAIPQRRFISNPMYPKILGVPSNVEHLPRAEPILPGRTLLLPEFGMLKSAIMFPHKELEDGAGVYGHVNKLGIKYDGRNERPLYTHFRRNNDDEEEEEERRRDSESSSSSSAEDSHFIHMMHKYKKILYNAVNKIQGGSRRRSQERLSGTNPYNKGQVKYTKTQTLLNKLQKLKLIKDQNFKIMDSQENYYEKDSREIYPQGPHTSNEVYFAIKKPKGFTDLQMTGDHFNLNSNAPEYNDIIPLVEIQKDEVTPWLYFCELQGINI